MIKRNEKYEGDDDNNRYPNVIVIFDKATNQIDINTYVIHFTTMFRKKVDNLFSVQTKKKVL